MAYIELVVVVVAAAFIGVAGLILIELQQSRREQRWLDRVSR